MQDLRFFYLLGIEKIQLGAGARKTVEVVKMCQIARMSAAGILRRLLVNLVNLFIQRPIIIEDADTKQTKR